MGDNRAFGEYVRRLREEKKRSDPSFSLRQFAAAVGVSPTFLSRMENGEFDPPGPDKIIRMAELLGVEKDDLLRMADKTDPELADMVRSPRPVIADFLRVARNIPDDVLVAALKELKEKQSK